jgi:ribosomal protein S18 acetylase RimI-like enzyme
MDSMVTQAPVKIAAASDANQVIQAIVLAFSGDPVIRWMYADPHEYLTCFPRFVMAFGGRAFEHDTAYRLNGFAGAALWLPPGVHPDVDALMDVLQGSVSGRVQDDLLSLLDQTESYHPSEAHWYLSLLGVDPARQRNGYGSALLKHTLARCDREGKMAYLESSNPENLSLYRRHGFELAGEIRAGNSPPLYPMLRRPQ